MILNSDYWTAKFVIVLAPLLVSFSNFNKTLEPVLLNQFLYWFLCWTSFFVTVFLRDITLLWVVKVIWSHFRFFYFVFLSMINVSLNFYLWLRPSHYYQLIARFHLSQKVFRSSFLFGTILIPMILCLGSWHRIQWIE